MPVITLATASKRGQVLESICAAIRTMTIAGGYRWDVTRDSVRADPVNPLGVAASRRPFFLVELSPPEDSGTQDYGVREFEPADQLTEVFPVFITVVADADGDDILTRKIATGEALAKDLEKVLTQDITRGGLCSDTRVMSPRILPGLGDDSTVVLVQRLECRLHRTHGAA